MNSEEKKIFEQLKNIISNTFLVNHNAPTNIKDWKGKDIIAFQEDLLHKVKGTVSEKWFYTYVKKDSDKLPRIDMLNLLSKYCGYENWENFKQTHNTITQKKIKKLSSTKLIFLASILILVFILYKLNATNEFQFCFVDDTKNEVVKSNLDIKILSNNESPIYLKTDSLGCFSYTTHEKMIQFIVQSPYYKTDTITRFIDSYKNGIIRLATDDYALVLQYYSNGNKKDWKKRKLQLKHLIDDNAQIYQVFTNNNSIELYDKNEFINKLMTPTSSLKNIRIVDKSYRNKKIVKLKFIVK